VAFAPGNFGLGRSCCLGCFFCEPTTREFGSRAATPESQRVPVARRHGTRRVRPAPELLDRGGFTGFGRLAELGEAALSEPYELDELKEPLLFGENRRFSCLKIDADEAVAVVAGFEGDGKNPGAEPRARGGAFASGDTRRGPGRELSDGGVA